MLKKSYFEDLYVIIILHFVIACYTLIIAMYILLIYTYQSISLTISNYILQTRKKVKNISFQYEVNNLKIFVVCPPI